MRTDTAIILAGGKSVRMGFDKQLIDVNGTPLTLKIANELEEFFTEIIIVSNTPELYVDTKYKVISDIFKGNGPISGIHVGLLNCTSDYAYLTACDMPYISSAYIDTTKTILNMEKEYDGLVSVINGYIEPMNGYYSKSLLPIIEEQIKAGNYKLRSLIKESNFYILQEKDFLEKNLDKNIFFNMNNVNDLKEYNDKKDAF